MNDRTIPLAALSERQRGLVQRHIPLVHHTLGRLDGLSARWKARREYGELIQEGCLALSEAVRHHDPSLHGDFAPFAMARIHFAVSRFAHEHGNAIRVPYITQRRHRDRAKSADRHDPSAPPRVVRLSPERAVRRRQRDRHPEAGADRPGGPSIGELLRTRYERALRGAMDRMTRANRCAPGAVDLLRLCACERWTIPDPEEKTAYRALAAKMGCSLGRVTHCEERVFRALAERLNSDPIFTRLRALARREEGGFDHRLSDEERAGLDID